MPKKNNPPLSSLEKEKEGRLSLTIPSLKIKAQGTVLPSEKEVAEYSAAFDEALALSQLKDKQERLLEEKKMLEDQTPAGIKESAQRAKRIKEIDCELKNLQEPKRPSQKHRLIARSVAEDIWRRYPYYTIAEVANSLDIHAKLRTRKYSNRTIRNWIKDLAHNRLPGRRKARH